jgi:hypothetical protein
MFRPFVTSIAVILLTASTLPAQEDWARRLFTVTEHDFGAVAKGAMAEYTFVITNNVQGDVHIASVRTSCGCTSPSIENGKSTLKTYETSGILAHLNSDTHIGQRAATLTVTFDRPAYAEVQLQIRALVLTNILMEPTSLQFGTVQQGKASEAKVRIYRADFGNWQIDGVHLSDPYLHGQVIPVARQGGQVWYDLKVTLDPKAPPGYLSDHAVLTTNDPLIRQMPIQVGGQVQPNVAVSPSDIFLGVVHVGEKVTKRLVVRADKPFRITSITGDKRAFEIPQPPSDAKSIHIIPVTFVAQDEIGKVVKTIHIETDIGGAQATSYAVVNEPVQK